MGTTTPFVSRMREEAKARRRAAYEARSGLLYVARNRTTGRLGAVVFRTPAQVAEAVRKHTRGGALAAPYWVF